MDDAQPASEARHDAADYEIRIKGHLDGLWAERFAGLTLRHEEDGTTLLAGPVVDQSALHGLLRTVRDLGMTLLAVTRLDSPQSLESTSAEDGAKRIPRGKEANP